LEKAKTAKENLVKELKEERKNQEELEERMNKA